jgi:hypothetical protein
MMFKQNVVSAWPVNSGETRKWASLLQRDGGFSLMGYIRSVAFCPGGPYRTVTKFPVAGIAQRPQTIRVRP